MKDGDVCFLKITINNGGIKEQFLILVLQFIFMAAPLYKNSSLRQVAVKL